MVSSSACLGFAKRTDPDFYILSGRFFFYLKLALVAGLILGSPVIFAQIWRFVSPGLYLHEKRLLLPFTFLSTICFVGGTIFAYYVVFPPVFRFLLGYGNTFLEALPSIGEFFPLALRLFLGFGLAFELPVLMVFLGKIGLVNASWLRENRKYGLLGALILAAVLTPSTDIVNMLLITIPLLLLYELSIVAVAFFSKKSIVTDKQENEESDEKKK